MENLFNENVAAMDINQRKVLADTVINNCYRIGEKTLASVPVGLLYIQDYQREELKTVSKIAQNWDQRKCGILLVSYDKENARFNLVDGQHRATAAKMKGLDYLVCEILFGMSTSKEAMLFAGQNECCKKLTPQDTFKASQFVAPEDDTEFTLTDKRLKKVCDKYGIKVTKGYKPHHLTGVVEARDIIKTHGEVVLEFIFDILEESKWSDQNKAYCKDVISALRTVYVRYSKSIDSRVLKNFIVDILSHYSPVMFFAVAQSEYSDCSRRTAMTRVLFAEVNKHFGTLKVA